MGWALGIHHAIGGLWAFSIPPTQRRSAPGIAAQPLHDATLGRALATLDAGGVTAFSRLRAATAVQRLGRTPTVAPRDRTSGPGEGRYHRHEAPADLHHVLRALRVEHHAGLPVRRTPRSGTTRAARALGPGVTEPLRQCQTSEGTTSLVADSALDRAARLPPRADTGTTWRTRVPATLTAAQTALAPALPEAL
jgi:hypothetical protein